MYLKNKTRVFFIEAEIHRYTQAFDYLSIQVLTPQESLNLVKQALRAVPA